MQKVLLFTGDEDGVNTLVRAAQSLGVRSEWELTLYEDVRPDEAREALRMLNKRKNKNGASRLSARDDFAALEIQLNVLRHRVNEIADAVFGKEEVIG